MALAAMMEVAAAEEGAAETVTETVTEAAVVVVTVTVAVEGTRVDHIARESAR